MLHRLILKYPKLDIIEYIIFRILYRLVSILRYINKPVEFELYINYWNHSHFEELLHELDNILIATIIFFIITGYD